MNQKHAYLCAVGFTLQHQDMKTFKNTKFTTRDYECTQVVFCQAETAPNDFWVECSELEIYRKNCTQLYKAGDQTFFGYL